jgi:glycosyltransferase involved in cell wall biosynthesis
VIVIATHFTLVGGRRYEAPTSTLVEVLEAQGADFVLVRHSIDGESPSTVHRYAAGHEVDIATLRIPRRPGPLRYLGEVVMTFLHIARHHRGADAFIGVDPLNALCGLMLRTLRVTRRSIFYTADYSAQRFTSVPLNRAYQAIDGLCVKRSTEVWSVSSRIVEHRAEQGLPPERNLFVPNIPAIPGSVSIDPEQRNDHQVITMGILGDQQDYSGLIAAVAELRHEFSDCGLIIVGNGPREDGLRAEVSGLGLDDHVTFTGFLSHAATLELVAASGVGAALYNGAWSFNHFGDSMKCREFMHFGLPILTTDSHSTVDEIRSSGAGVVSEQSTEAYVSALRQIFAGPDTFSAASREVAARHRGVHERMLARAAAP